MKTSELEGIQLDWAVAKAEGLNLQMRNDFLKDKARRVNIKTESLELILSLQQDNTPIYVKDDCPYDIPYYSYNWFLSGEIIEREEIRLMIDDKKQWWAEKHLDSQGNTAFQTSFDKAIIGQGSTPLIAAMRCYVASKLGDEVDIPEELL